MSVICDVGVVGVGVDDVVGCDSCVVFAILVPVIVVLVVVGSVVVVEDVVGIVFLSHVAIWVVVVVVGELVVFVRACVAFYRCVCVGVGCSVAIVVGMHDILVVVVAVGRYVRAIAPVLVGCDGSSC